jgi:hypothetical protein
MLSLEYLLTGSLKSEEVDDGSFGGFGDAYR